MQPKQSSCITSAGLVLVSAMLLQCGNQENKQESAPDETVRNISSETGKPPNVLLIVVDDQGYADMSCTGLTTDVSTPNMDKLAANGVRFTQAYATSPISSPSRGGLLTGCYHERWGTFWYGGPGLHDTTFVTIPELLKQSGYKTGYIGKIHYGGHDSDTTHRSFPLNHGFDYYFGHTSARKHYFNHKQSIEDAFQQVKTQYNRKGQSLRQQPLWENKNPVDTIAFTTELFGKKACEYLKQHKDSPFFLQLAFNAVHNFTHQLPHDYLDENNLKGYHDWNPEREDYYEWYKQGRYPNNAEGRAHYLGQLHFLDKEIGRVMECLHALDLDNNTIVVYISDNGGSTPIYANNKPLRGSKYLLYEGGIRVPMIFSFPEKFKTGVICNNVVSGMDILPTICANLKIKVPKHVDGKDLTPLLCGEDKSIKHDTLVWDTGQEIAVRAGKWKLHIAEKDEHAKYEMVDLEVGEHLYNLEQDTGETTNLASEHPEIVKQLKAVHKRWKDNL